MSKCDSMPETCTWFMFICDKIILAVDNWILAFYKKSYLMNWVLIYLELQNTTSNLLKVCICIYCTYHCMLQVYWLISEKHCIIIIIMYHCLCMYCVFAFNQCWFHLHFNVNQEKLNKIYYMYFLCVWTCVCFNSVFNLKFGINKSYFSPQQVIEYIMFL